MGAVEGPEMLCASSLVRTACSQRLSRNTTARSCQSAAKELVYTGPFHKMLRAVKMVSVFSCGSTVVSIPILGALNDTISLQGRVTIGTTCLAFAFSSTALVHWVGGPYVAHIWRMPSLRGEQSWQVQTLTLFARPKIAQIALGDIEAPTGSNPFVSFAATTGNHYYIHSDSSLFGEHLDLYHRLNLSASRKSEPQ